MSEIFEPYRALGLHSADVPFIVRHAPHSNGYNVLVPIGERFNIYQLPKLAIVATSDSIGENIKSFASCGKHVFVAAGKTIYNYRNSRYLIGSFGSHDHNITHLLGLDSSLLASSDEYKLKVWDIDTKAIIFESDFPPKAFKITFLFHPIGYRNKLLIGSFQGPLQLWNVKRQKQLFWFQGFGSPVTCIQQAPAMDVCAIGCADGCVYLHNIRFDTTILRCVQDGGAVTAIDFRNGSAGLNNPSNVDERNELTLLSSQTADDLFMVTGCATGLVHSWQLKKGGESRSVGRAKQMHWDRVNSIYCVPNGDCAGAMVTSGADNCLKVSYFDRADGGPRTVYKRSGHYRPPTRVMFWPGGAAGGRLLVSAGLDSVLRIFSTTNEHFDKSLGRAYAPGAPSRHKASEDQRSTWLLPGATQLAICASRAEDWDSLVAIHDGRRQATTWNFVNATRGRHWLDPAKFRGHGGAAVRLYKHTTATSVFITNCGNYVLLGYSSGDVFKFNLQSGLERGSYGDPTAHSGAVVGISVNNVNRLTITTGGSEVRFWLFHEHKLLDSIELPSVALFTRFLTDNDTLAVSLDNGPIILLDVLRRCVIRRFPVPDHQACVDLALSSDGRWLISAHRRDPLIRTWDIVNGRLIDCFRVSSPITSIALSPAAEFLATTHANSLGVYLWDNRATYRRLHLQPLDNLYVPSHDAVPTHVPSKSFTNAFGLDFASESLDGVDPGSIDDMNMDIGAQDAARLADDYISPLQLQDRLATLSGLPASYLNSFLHLDLVRERNRRAVLPGGTNSNQQANLPFFLPVIETSQGLTWIDDDADNEPVTESIVVDGESDKVNVPHKRPKGLLQTDSSFGTMESVPGFANKLLQAKEDIDFDALIDILKSLGSSALDLEIRLLAPSVDDEQLFKSNANSNDMLEAMFSSRDRLHAFLRLLINRFERNLDVDFSCVCLEVLLQRHGELIISKLAYSSASSNAPDDITASLFNEVPTDEEENSSITFNLVSQAVRAKRKAQTILSRRVTRSTCLIDFIRNPTTALQF